MLKQRYQGHHAVLYVVNPNHVVINRGAQSTVDGFWTGNVKQSRRLLRNCSWRKLTDAPPDGGFGTVGSVPHLPPARARS